MHAASFGHVHCITGLLLHEPEEQVQYADDEGLTALMWAARAKHADCFAALLQCLPETQLRATDGEGCTALMWAARNGAPDCVAALLRSLSGEQVLASDDDGDIALMHAVRCGKSDCVTTLLQYHPAEQVQAANAFGYNALCVASSVGLYYLEVVERLLRYDPQLQLRTVAGCSALKAAAQGGRDADVIRLLLLAGAYPHDLSWLEHAVVQPVFAALCLQTAIPERLNEAVVAFVSSVHTPAQE
jgi:Ankyrin repeats (3 copies)